MKILVVDDTEVMRDLLRNYLGDELGHDVVTAVNGREGLQRVVEFRPDVVVTDVDMPDLSGLGLAYEIGQLFPRLPVIIMSGRAYFQPGEKLVIQTHARAFFAKPFALAELRAAVEGEAENRKSKIENRNPEDVAA